MGGLLSVVDVSPLRWFQRSFGYTQILPLTLKSKEALLKEFCECDEVSAKNFYCQLLTEIKLAVSNDDFESFKILIDVLNSINTYKIPEKVHNYKLYAYDILGNINLIILACKSAALRVLEHLLSGENHLYDLPFLADRSSILPEDTDKDGHNAFYYAIRSNATNLLKMLIEKWPNSYFGENPDAMDDILSNEYNELMIRKVHLSKDMELYIKKILVDFRFFHDNTAKKATQNSTEIQDRKTLFMTRIDFVLEKIAHIKDQFWSTDTDEQFIIEAKFIAKNIHMLKSQFVETNFTYDKLPWGEMEFCLIIFIRACMNSFELDPLYHFVLNKKRVLMHLQNFSDRLRIVKEELATLDFDEIPKLKLKREEVIESRGNAIFKNLYDDFAQVRDLYTLETIRKHVDLALSTDVTQKDGQLLIVRVLQVIGENFKNTLHSPKLTDGTAQLLFSALQSGTKDTISRLRDALSHVEALSVRSEIEENAHSFFSDLQTDIAQMNKVLVDVIRKNKAAIIKNVFNEIKECKSFDGVKEILDRNHISAQSFEKELEESKNLNMSDMEQFEMLISQLHMETDKEISFSKEVLRQTRDMLQGKHVQTYNDASIPHIITLLTYSLWNENSEPLPYEIGEIVPFSMDFKLFEKVLADICFKNELKEIKFALESVQWEQFPEIKKILSQITEIGNENPINVKDIEELSKLVAHLEEKNEKKSKYEKEIFHKIYGMIKCEKSRLKGMQEDFSDLISFFMDVISMKKEQCSDVDLCNLIQNIQTKFSFLSQSSNLNILMDQLYFILRSISSQIGPEISRGGASLRKTILTIFNFVEFRMGQIKLIKEFRHMLQSDQKMKHRKTKGFDKGLEDQFTGKLDLLEKFVKDNHIDETSTEKFKSCEKDPKLKSLIEMLLLDSMTTLECLPNYLAHNPFYLDTVYPVVNGKNLRNHIAHGNTLVSILIGDEFTNVLLNVKKSITTKFNIDEIKDQLQKAQNQTGKKTKNDPNKLKNSQDKNVSTNVGKEKKKTEKQTGKKAKSDPTKVAQDRNLSPNNDQEENKTDKQTGKKAKNNPFKLEKSQLSTNIDQVENKTGKQISIKEKNYPLTLKESSERSLTAEADQEKKQTAKKIKIDTGKLKERQEYDKQIGKKIKNNPIKLKKSAERDVLNVKQQQELFIALSEGSMLKVMKFIRKGADIGGLDLKSWTSLHFAAKGPSLEVLKFVLHCNPDPNVRNVSLQTALHIAAIHGRPVIVEHLVQVAKIPVDDRDIDGKTPLHHACENGRLDAAKCLLKHKAKTTSKDLSGYYPLHYAIAKNHIEVANFLMEKEYNVDAVTGPSGLTALHIAAGKGLLNVIDSLLKRNADVDSLTDMHIVPLHYAAKGGHVEVVKYLIGKGAKVNAESVDGLTPLHWAVETGNKEIVDVLLLEGTDVNATCLNGLSPLSLAAKGGHSSIAKVLIDNGANVETASFETNPLSFAAHFGHYECAEMLMQKTDNTTKISALHEATINGHLDIVELLAGEVSNINAVYNGTDFTTLHLAAAEGHNDIIKFLFNTSCDINVKAGGSKPKRILSTGNQAFSDLIDTPIDEGVRISDITGNGQTALHLCARNGHRDTVQLLLQLKADIGIKDDFGRTSLHIMIMKDMADILMEENAKVNIPDCGEFTALHLAAGKGNIEFIDYCIKNGCEVNSTGTTGLTPLHIAVAWNQKDAAEHLLAIGANIDVVSDEGYTAVAAAIEQNNKELFELLLNKKAKMSAEEEREYMLTSVRNGHEDIVEYFIFRNPENVAANPVNDQYPLHVAVQFGHLNIVKKLLKELDKKEDIKKKEINLINQRFMTPLLNAVALDFCEIAYLLLSKEADPNIPTPEGFMPIHVAIMKGCTKMLEILLKFKAKVLVNVPTGNSTIELAIQFNNLEHVEILLQHPEIDVNAKDYSGCNLLHKAASNGSLEIVKHLVDKNADVNAKDSKGAKPIHYAALRGHQDIVQYFMELGLSINERGGRNWSLLHYAASRNHSGICKFLMENNLNVNVTDAQGNTALHIAAQMGQIDVLHTLLQNESHYDIHNQSNKTPLDVTGWENLRIKTSLTLIQNLFTTVQKNELKKTEVLLHEGIKFSEFGYANIKNSKNNALIHYAAWKGYEEIVNILLKYKAEVNITSENGSTALHYACKFSHFKIARILLHNGAIFEAQCKDKKIPVEYATDETIIHLLKFMKEMFDRTQNGDISVLENLKEIGDLDTAKAMMRAKNIDGRNLASLSIVSNHPKAEQFNELFQNDTFIPLKMAEIFYEQGQYKESLNEYNTILKKRIDLFGEDNPGVWDIQVKMSAIHIYQGNYDKALSLAKHVYEKCKHMLGRFRKETLAAKTQLALILGHKGQKQQAINILEEVSNKQRETLGLFHTETLTTLTYMMQLLYDINTLEKPLEICEEILLAFNVCPQVCWWVWGVENTKGNILSKQGKHEEAMKMFVKIYERQKRMPGLFHSDISQTLYNIAVLFQLMGKEEESLEVFKNVLNSQIFILGEEHPNSLQTRYCIANVLFSQRKFYEALKIYEEDFEKRKAILGEDNPEIVQTRQRINFINFKLKSHFLEIDLKWKFKTLPALYEP
ncbi:Ankyrin-3 [Araneus ventricosus]|uniref:Alpha-latrotoxin n=1 Tax=Araneus ventricosus TaxID=182803 RepID=A0A4Y2M6H8_ARAVE|nr:Ankyrin-3 [Araneus ventricosus]